ncbi:DNA ligase D [Amycolatopsis nigrescens]|uniref:DNA ligase D n=1 Tax=Amycolatopsis nigrescens TaxID=381445 RepID=UPI00039C3F83|nr:DNA ligase D [Amycolatopsis nigrescens]
MANARDARSPVPEWVRPMLAKPDGGRLRSGPQWAYEPKLDGYRACMRIAPDGTTRLTSRNGIDFTGEFAQLADVLGGALDGTAAVLDGEIVVYNEAGQVDFGLLQERRGRYQKQRGSLRGDQPFDDVAVRFLAFDLLRLGDTRLLAEPYDERRRLLAELPMPDPYRVAVVPAYTFDQLAADRRTPQDLLDRVSAAGMEGLICKLRTSAYQSGERPETWLKHPLIRTQEVILCGWRPGQRSFAGTLGGLLLGAHDPGTGELVYLGDVGTGFSRRERADLQARLEPLERRTPPFATAPPREDVARAHWIEPVLVGEVVYRQFTRGAGRLRHTAWRGLRADREPAEVIAPEPSSPAVSDGPAVAAQPEPPEPAVAPGGRITVQAGKRRLTLSNLDKTLYPDGFTKGEVINYYSRVAPVLLPHLKGRPVTTIRYPDGVGAQQFFGKNVPRGAPDWLPTVVLPSSGSRGEAETVRYPLFEELPALVWAANLAALELHVPQWTVGPGPARRAPDRLVFDLDPGEGATIVECAMVAERLQEILVGDGLTPVAKTSGAKGMQVYAGVRTRQPERPSGYAKAVAEQLARETPDLVVAKMTKTLRTRRVFIDWSQNNPAKTTVAPYSLRGRDQPTVSTPVTWDEVRSCRRASQLVFTADDVLDRVDQLGDLFAVLAETRVALPAR